MTTILIVEDELDLRFGIRDFLVDEGYTVLEASNGAEALALLAGKRPDVILTDVMMPILNGEELLERLRADPEYRDLPVIVMSAGGGGPRVATKYGAAFMSKPFMIETLLRGLAAATRKSVRDTRTRP